MTLETLKKLIKTMPKGPGVYIYKNSSGSPIYIGKAASIKHRLISYTRNDDHRINQMIAVATTVEAIETPTEIEALILESQLIKQRRPEFNIMLRDDKRYFYVGFTNDESPRITLTHQPESADKSVLKTSSGGDQGNRRDWFPKSGRKGRFSADYIGPFTDGASLKSTLRLLRSIFPYCTCKQPHNNFCLNYHIGKCLGICCLKQPELRMTSDELIILKTQYQQNIKAIKNILEGKKSTLIKELTKQMDELARSDKLEEAIKLRNKIERLEQVFANAQIIKSSEVLRAHQPFLTKVLKSQKPIIRIEGYDISNIQGEHATGSMVTFINGEPDKNFYRKFNIRTVRGANDTAMLAEILERRLRHDEWPFPELIIVDGGKGQTNIARAILRERGITIPLIGLVKNDKHIGRAILVEGKKSNWRTIELPKLTAADRQLILAIDAEAHRFAISHYRSRHRRSFRHRIKG